MRDVPVLELFSLMLHAKFQDNRPSGSENDNFITFLLFYSNGGHHGHETCTIDINFQSHFLKILYMTFSFDWKNWFQKRRSLK